ncbi:MAG: protein kinase [Gemmatimonadaceae bacterium]|nr:protein kinase [Gemmatimonadaceae bacterium]
MASSGQDELQGSLGDGYRITRELRSGGMSRVFEAVELSLGRRVAVKLLTPDFDGVVNVERFRREITLSAQLHHPHIVTILGAGVCGELPYYIMPFIDGETLRERLQRGPLPIADCVDILRDVAKALAFAHLHSIVHRDIKPDNVMLTGGSAVVTDFGIAKALVSSLVASRTSPTLTDVGMAIGTPAYMAPEQIAVDPAIDQRADLYALGATAYEMLAGDPPFGLRPTASLFAAHLIELPPPLSHSRPDVPEALEQLVMHCLAKDPEDRPQHARDLLGKLDAIALGSLAHTTAARSSHSSSIGVLPFINMSADRTNDYLSDGITEELMTALGKLPGLRVAARASCFAYKGQSPDPRTAGAQLRVQTLLTGNVRQSENRLRIGAELVRAQDATPLWSDRFDRKVTDIFVIQDEITTSIVNALRLQLVKPAPEDLRQRHTANVDAYTLYLRGRYFFNRRQEPALWRSLDCYRDAIALDDNYQLAYCGIADSCAILALFMALPPGEARARMQHAAERALALDETLADAHLSVACYEMLLGWDLDRAESHFRRALQLDPLLPMANVWMGQLLVQRGRVEEGLASAARGMSLEPLSVVVHTTAAFAYHLAGHNVDAVRILDGVLELDPGRPTALWILAWSQLGLGDTAAAIATLERSLDSVRRNPWWLGSLAFAYAEDGRVEDAWRVLDELAHTDGSHYVQRALLARAHLALGDREEAFRLAKEALQAHELNAWGILVHPGWSELRGHPEFAALSACVAIRTEAIDGD